MVCTTHIWHFWLSPLHRCRNQGSWIAKCWAPTLIGAKLWQEPCLLCTRNRFKVGSKASWFSVLYFFHSSPLIFPLQTCYTKPAGFFFFLIKTQCWLYTVIQPKQTSNNNKIKTQPNIALKQKTSVRATQKNWKLHLTLNISHCENTERGQIKDKSHLYSLK